MRKTVGQAALAAVLAIGLGAAVAAQPPVGGGMRGQGPMGGGGMRGGQMGHGMMGQRGPGMRRGGGLNLSAEQREKVQKLQQTHRAANQAAAETMRGLRDQLRTALFAEDLDQATELGRQIGHLQAQMLPSRIAMQVEILKLLTPDQKKMAMERNLFGRDGMPGGPAMRGGQPPPVKK